MSADVHVWKKDEHGALPERVPFESLKSYQDNPEWNVWVNLNSAEEKNIEALSEIFKLHPVLVEDFFSHATIPKLQVFSDYLYLILHVPFSSRMKKQGWTLEEVGFGDLDIFLGKDWIISFHEGEIDAESILADMKEDPGIHSSVSRLMQHLIHSELQAFETLAMRTDELVDSIETQSVESASHSVLEQILNLKHHLHRVRRISNYQRDILYRLYKEELEAIPKDHRPFFRRTFELFARMGDMNETYREIAASSMEAYLSMQSHRLGEITKFLTLISTIMLPLTFIAGVYGMNFKTMPELEHPLGYPMVLAGMGVVALGFYIWFRLKRWW